MKIQPTWSLKWKSYVSHLYNESSWPDGHYLQMKHATEIKIPICWYTTSSVKSICCHTQDLTSLYLCWQKVLSRSSFRPRPCFKSAPKIWSMLKIIYNIKILMTNMFSTKNKNANTQPYANIKMPCTRAFYFLSHTGPNRQKSPSRTTVATTERLYHFNHHIIPRTRQISR